MNKRFNVKFGENYLDKVVQGVDYKVVEVPDGVLVRHGTLLPLPTPQRKLYRSGEIVDSSVPGPVTVPDGWSLVVPGEEGGLPGGLISGIIQSYLRGYSVSVRYVTF